MREKGLSPLIATVLLIAFTFAVAGLVSLWITGFTKTSTNTVTENALSELVCSNARIALSDVLYCSNRISGVITNTGRITLGNITMQEVFSNQSTQTFYLCKGGATVSTCTGASNLTLLPREVTAFNITIGNSNYGTTRIFSNCSSSGFDDIKQSDHQTC